ncbi:16S rRNA methyltransferase [Neosynechococcus sphagnicola sy1]|uniref:Ribosomal RNA small subunit methyltransferase A n=1 Tax=Neosynechococcus sphagnicola sy1 TaxID=1497020 RepID=A0A098TJ54_9CYAN|nr:16S rRNA (adenine(1518)-N(6)/adenine(1519)-N(6))-dimethyltransferase RsmA [Neosynechococcus sphagnicola]KGF72565.1 16S rRNA methyltransferase [Neosynechococcus sphagnicola sy1]
MAPRPRKRFGQHWLRSDQVLNQIVQAADLSRGDRVLEIGPGTGLLTKRLLPLVAALVAVEIDRHLCDRLSKQFRGRDNFLLLAGDFLSLDLAAHLGDFPAFQHPNKVVANIPYNITGPILERLLGSIAQPVPQPFATIVLLVQKEVAERLTAPPGSRVYGALSVRVQYLANCEWICGVPACAFEPPPQVDSAVVRLCPRPLATPALDPRRLETLIQMGFASRRKMLRNNLKAVIEPTDLTRYLEELKVNPQARAEDLSLPHWIALSNLLSGVS